MLLSDLYSIGELTRILKISPDTLRYYDEIGLIVPAHRNPETGYRYYAREQLEEIVRVLEWKRFGFPLKEIRRMMEHPDEIAERFRKQLDVLTKKQSALDGIIGELGRIIQRLEEEKMRKTVMIVDDVEFMNSTLTTIAEENGYTVVTRAYNGAEAIEQLKEVNPDYIILDIIMPKMDGIDTLRALRKQGVASTVVMCSGLADITPVIQSLEAGANGFVRKPFRAEWLVAAMEAAVGYKADPDKAAKRMEEIKWQKMEMDQAAIDDLFEEMRA